MKASVSRFLHLAAMVFSIVVTVFFLACNFISPGSKLCSDFMVSFYVAGRLFLKGDSQSLYPGINCSSWVDAPINAIAHSMLPGLPPALTANFMYSPLVAAIFVPFAALSTGLSMAVWQAFNIVLILLFPVLLFGKKRKLAADFAFSMCFAPVLACIWVGQCSLLFGVLPFALSLVLLAHGLFFCSGLALALLSLKPQLLILALVLAVFSAQRLRVLAGLGSGVLSLFAVNLLLVPFPVFANWLHSLGLSERFLGGPGYSMAPYLAASLPSAILLALPADSRSVWHLWIYALAAIFGCGVLFWLRRRLRILSFEKQEAFLPVSLAACLAEIVMSPRFILYDCSILLVPLLLALHRSHADIVRIIAFYTFAFVNAYVLFCMLGEPNPLVFVIGLLILTLLMIFSFRRKQDS